MAQQQAEDEDEALEALCREARRMAQSVEDTEAAQVPLGRRGVTDDLVPWMLQLGSPANNWVTGQVVTVDGGWSLKT